MRTAGGATSVVSIGSWAIEVTLVLAPDASAAHIGLRSHRDRLRNLS